jgi:DNA-binding NarL/FixJ family response regulator
MPQFGKPLTSRQRQIAACIERGLTNDEAAEELGISARTVKAHVEVIRRRLGVAKRRLIPAALRKLEGRD